MLVSEGEWDAKNQSVRGDSREARDKNLIISNARAKISDILVRARLSNEKLTKEIIFRRYKKLDDGDLFDTDSDNFIKFCYEYLDQISTSIGEGTYSKRKGMIKKIENYDPSVSFNQITPEWLRQYSSHLRDEYNNGPGTIKKNMDTMRLFFRVAMRQGKASQDPFEHFKLPTYYPEITFLSEKELKKLTKLRGNSAITESQELTLDLFLFMAFTGMHYTDAGNLRIEDIRDGEIHYRRQKTGTLVHVPISKPSSILIDKFRSGRQRGKLFEIFPTNQQINRSIKEVCSIGKIYNKKVSAITARHTFATIFYRKTKDIGTLSKLLGHTTVKNTMIYTHIIKEDRVQGVSVFDSLM